MWEPHFDFSPQLASSSTIYRKLLGMFATGFYSGSCFNPQSAYQVFVVSLSWLEPGKVVEVRQTLPMDASPHPIMMIFLTFTSLDNC